jgi:hypothetical protein
MNATRAHPRVLLAAVLVASGAAVAEPAPAQRRPPQVYMPEADMQATFGGKTIEGHYADGVDFSETYGADGRIDYREKGRNMTGRWSVRAGTFCTIYDTSPTGGCYRVVRKGANCFEFYFVARDETVAEQRPGLPAWTAQGWVKGQHATCKEEPTV